MSLYEDVLLDCEDRMDKAVEYFTDEVRTIRTGRASPALVETLKVDYYGSPTQLRELASITVPEPRLLVIKPFDPGSCADIERAVQASSLGITPNNDGKLIRLAVPPLSEEQRLNLVGRIKEQAEDAKVSLRNVRREMIKLADAADSKELPEDDAHALKGEIQDFIKSHEEKVAEVLEGKTREIMDE